MARVTYTDRGLKWLQGNIKALNSHVLTIGYQGPSGAQLYPTGVNLATVALFNEFGTITIPSRPALRSAMWVHQDRISRILERATSEVILSLDAFAPARAFVTAFGRAGTEIAALVRIHIQNSLSWARDNAPSTVDKKGFNYPLHEEYWRIARDVTWAVRKWAAEGEIIAQGR